MNDTKLNKAYIKVILSFFENAFYHSNFDGL